MVIEMTVATYFITYFGFVIMGTMAICGWFGATRGYIEELPDGTKEKKGKALRAWYFFWMKELDTQKMVHFKGKHLEAVADFLNERKVAVIELNDATIATTGKIPIKEVKIIEEKYSAKLIQTGPAEYTMVKLYTQYRFPWWVRDMMAGCITCHPTVYGNIIFFLLVLLTKYSILGQEMFCFLDLPWYGFVGTWFMYWLTLSFTCTVAWKHS